MEYQESNITQNDNDPFFFKEFHSKISPGLSYLIKEQKTKKGFLIASDLSANGWEGVVIMREQPKIVRKAYELEKVNICWLTSHKHENESCFSSQHISRLSSVISKHLGMGRKHYVLLDGFEYLVTESGFNQVLNLMHFIHDQVMAHESNFILSLDPSALDRKHLSLMEKEFETVF